MQLWVSSSLKQLMWIIYIVDTILGLNLIGCCFRCVDCRWRNECARPVADGPADKAIACRPDVESDILMQSGSGFCIGWLLATRKEESNDPAAVVINALYPIDRGSVPCHLLLLSRQLNRPVTRSWLHFFHYYLVCVSAFRYRNESQTNRDRHSPAAERRRKLCVWRSLKMRLYVYRQPAH